MKSYFIAISCLIFIIINYGCTGFVPIPVFTTYNMAVDERSINTIVSDIKIKTLVLDAFIQDKTVKTFDIDVACYYGYIYLIGEYDTDEQKNRAIELAANIKGAKDVETYLLKKKKGDPCRATDNIAITTKLKTRLIKDKDIWSTNIEITTVQCNVVLVGIVRSKKEVEKIIAYAKNTGGIRRVKSFLKVAPHYNQ